MSDVYKAITGQSDFQATAPEVDAGAFEHGGNQYRNRLAQGAFGGGRAAPQAGFNASAGAGARTATSFINTNPANAAAAQGAQSRAQQAQALGLLAGAAQGTAPSVAQQQLRLGMDQGLQQQAALAASARGGPGAQALAQRQAAMQGAQLQQNMAGQAGLLRAQEMAQARGQFADAAGQIRAGDLGQQQQAFNQALNQAQLSQQANLANAGFAQQARIANAGFDQQTSLANLQAELQSRGLDDQQQRAFLGSLLGLDQAQLQANIGYEQLLSQNALAAQGINAGIAQGNAAGQQGFFGGLIGGGASMGAAALLSDKRAKKDIAPAGKKLDAFLGSLKPATFKYKHNDQPMAGIMAQDLEKSEVGKTMVREGPDGLKRVDIAAGVSALLASNARLHKRLRSLERGKGKRNASR